MLHRDHSSMTTVPQHLVIKQHSTSFSGYAQPSNGRRINTQLDRIRNLTKLVVGVRRSPVHTRYAFNKYETNRRMRALQVTYAQKHERKSKNTIAVICWYIELIVSVHHKQKTKTRAKAWSRLPKVCSTPRISIITYKQYGQRRSTQS